MARMPSPRRMSPSPSASCLTSAAKDRSMVCPLLYHTRGRRLLMAYFTTTDGVRLYYEEHGPGGPRGPGPGEAPADPTRVTFGHWVLDLHDLLDHLALDRPVVGGLSLGGG